MSTLWPLPAIATTFLVLSSVTMQFAIWAIRRGDRLTMLRYGVNDLRLFFENDLRFLKQFN